MIVQPKSIGCLLGRSAGAVLAVICGMLAQGCGAPAESPDRTQRAGDESSVAADTGWVYLFDGESFEGWRGVGRENIPDGHWVVEEGSIRKVKSGDVRLAPDGQPMEGGDIMTVETFRDFEFVFEWKVSPGGNSGVKYNVSEPLSVENDPPHAALGFEYQVLDDEMHPDAALATHQAAALYDLVAAGEAKSLRPVGEWNSSRIVLVGNRGEHWLNGKIVLEYDLASAEFDSLFQASKYAPIEAFRERREGHIVLQDHTDDVWFRNLKIRELNE